VLSNATDEEANGCRNPRFFLWHVRLLRFKVSRTFLLTLEPLGRVRFAFRKFVDDGQLNQSAIDRRRADVGIGHPFDGLGYRRIRCRRTT
jgi:hypothetical protein